MSNSSPNEVIEFWLRIYEDETTTLMNNWWRGKHAKHDYNTRAKWIQLEAQPVSKSPSGCLLEINALHVLINHKVCKVWADRREYCFHFAAVFVCISGFHFKIQTNCNFHFSHQFIIHNSIHKYHSRAAIWERFTFEKTYFEERYWNQCNILKLV